MWMKKYFMFCILVINNCDENKFQKKRVKIITSLNERAITPRKTKGSQEILFFSSQYV